MSDLLIAAIVGLVLATHLSGVAQIVAGYRQKRPSIFVNGLLYAAGGPAPLLVSISIPNSYDLSIRLGAYLLITSVPSVLWVLLDAKETKLRECCICVAGFVFFAVAHFVYSHMP